ncbi:MAG: septum formation initiator family protein [Spirochaetia bacterium]|nr:septum formation initiator family protein [Spirochaetia bacterium]
MIILYFSLSSVFSSKGYFANRQLREELMAQEAQEQELEAQTAALAQEQTELEQGKGVLDGVYHLGFVENGDSVYRLDLPKDNQEKGNTDTFHATKEAHTFIPLSRKTISLISLAFSLAICLFSRIISYHIQKLKER